MPRSAPDRGTRKRISLTLAGVMFAVYLTYPLLTAFTPVLDGVVGGIGVAYIAGAIQIVLALGVGLAYRRWANRLDEEG